MPTPSERSLALFPAGSLGEYNLPPELVRVLVRGEGTTVWDTEGRRYTDFTMGWGSVLLGHAHPAVTEAVRRQAGLGSNFAYVTEPALELAEELVRAVPCAAMADGATAEPAARNSAAIQRACMYAPE